MSEHKKTVKELRTETKMSQSAFAAFMGVPVRTLQDWEQERRTPPEYVVTMMERILDNEYFKISAEKHIGTWNKALEILEVAENKRSSEYTCKGCIYENDESEETECGHCRRAYSDCYEGNKK